MAMIAALSPAKESWDETLSSLRFASRVRMVEKSHATQAALPGHLSKKLATRNAERVVDLEVRVPRLEAEIARLKDENPHLKLSQYKERAFAAWQKSEDNPKNQEAAVEVS